VKMFPVESPPQLPVLERLLFRPQVSKQLSQFADVGIGLSVGGLDLRAQEASLRKNPAVVIATPGRLIDHIQNTPSFGLESIEVRFALD
jgi:superfamily II DNA/RNA helicase